MSRERDQEIPGALGNTLKLEDGKFYRDGMGATIKVHRILQDCDFPFVGHSGLRYTEDGSYTVDKGLPTDIFSLIEEVKK